MPSDKPRNTDEVLLARRRKVAQLYLEGNSQAKIGELVKVSQSCISQDLKAIRDQWTAEMLVDFGERRAAELAKIDNLETVAWAAWYRSCKPATTKVKKTELAQSYAKKEKGDKRAAPEPPKLVPIKVLEELRRSGQAGDPRFLERVSWCIETRLKLTGQLKESSVTNNIVAAPTGFWDQLLGKPTKTAADEIEAAVLSALPAPTTSQEVPQ